MSSEENQSELTGNASSEENQSELTGNASILGSLREKEMHVSAEKMISATCDLRVMKSEDVPEVLEMIHENGLGYAAPLLVKYMQLDPEAVNVAVDLLGRVIGVCCCIKTNENLYILRCLCVHADYRCQGVGNKLVSWCLNRAGDKNLSVSGDVEKQSYYIKRGFCTIGKKWVFREYNMKHSLNFEDCLPKGIELYPFQDNYHHAILDYAQSVVGCKDSTLLQENSKSNSFRTVVALQNGACVGFGSIALNSTGANTVEPIYADGILIAEGILKTLIKDIPTGSIFAIGLLNANKSLEEILGKFELKRWEEDVRLHTKEIVEEDSDRVFAMSFAI